MRHSRTTTHTIENHLCQEADATAMSRGVWPPTLLFLAGHDTSCASVSNHGVSAGVHPRNFNSNQKSTEKYAAPQRGGRNHGHLTLPRLSTPPPGLERSRVERLIDQLPKTHSHEAAQKPHRFQTL